MLDGLPTMTVTYVLTRPVCLTQGHGKLKPGEEMTEIKVRIMIYKPDSWV